MHPRSVSAGGVVEGEPTHRHRPAAAVATADAAAADNDRENGTQCGQLGVGSAAEETVDRSIVGHEEPIMLTRSTHSFLFTEPTRSVPFAFAVGVASVSWTCLFLALIDNKGNTWGNVLNVPVSVDTEVRIAQYFSLLVGLMMEEEIPESLYLLRMITEESLRDRAPNLEYGKFVFCACVRILMGYFFYLNMFVVVAQATGVIDMFYDVMALQFLLHVDKIAFRLARWDVLGKHLKRASTRKCFRTEFEKLPFARRKRRTIFVKALYVFNLLGMIAGMTCIAIKQDRGDYHCPSITVKIDDQIWQNALALNSTGGVEEMDLIYSYFNGVYVLNTTLGNIDGRPVYTEQNKANSSPYREKIGAIIRYCNSEGAWVFMHDHIRKDKNTKDHDCPWLLRSPDTDSYNLLEVQGDWSIWIGIISTGATFETTCNGCGSEADCNYHGTCEMENSKGRCECEMSEDDSYPLFMGTHCEFPRPCLELTSTIGDTWRLHLFDNKNPWLAYGRGLYVYAGESISIPEDDGIILVYSGSRWFGSYFEGLKQKSREFLIEYSREIHAFWDRVYERNTKFVSNPTSRSDPIAVDIFKIGQRGEKYGPLGELIPLQDPPGSGFFECSPLSLIDLVSEVSIVEADAGK